jgi:hypothetical protein
LAATLTVLSASQEPSLETVVSSDHPLDNTGLAPGEAALRARINPETGQVEVSVAPLSTPLDAQTLEALRRDTEGLKETFHPDGSVSVHLQGRFQSVSVARIDQNGKATICSENIEQIEAMRRAAGQPTQGQPPEVR